MPTIEQVETNFDNKLRATAAATAEFAVDVLESKTPWITPNMLTTAGTVGSIFMNYLAVKNPNNAGRLAVPHSGFSLLDLADGCKARRHALANGSETTFFGEIVDLLGDRTQQASSFLSQAMIAKNNNDRFTMGINALAAATSPLPSLVRANLELQNKPIDINSRSIPGARTSLGILGLGLSKSPKTSAIVGTGVVAWNLSTTYKLMCNIRKEPYFPPVHDEKNHMQARRRYKTLRVATGAIVAASLFSVLKK